MTSARDDALLWLNDHLNAEVDATMQLDVGGWNETLFGVSGTLRHWRQEPYADQIAALDPTGRRDDIIGLYRIGDSDTILDFSGLPDDRVIVRPWTVGGLAEAIAGQQPPPGSGMILDFGDGITLKITSSPAADEEPPEGGEPS